MNWSLTFLVDIGPYISGPAQWLTLLTKSNRIRFRDGILKQKERFEKSKLYLLFNIK